MNAGVLKFKHDSELALQASGIPYTLLRPSRLTDGPYTSYDLNTLLQVWVWCWLGGGRREGQGQGQVLPAVQELRQPAQ